MIYLLPSLIFSDSMIKMVMVTQTFISFHRSLFHYYFKRFQGSQML